MGLRGRTQRGVLGWLLVLSGAEASGGFCRVDMHCGDLPEDAGTVNVAYCEFHRSVFAFFFLATTPSSDLIHVRQPAGSCVGNVCYCTVGASGAAAYGCPNCGVSIASDTGTGRKMTGLFNGLEVDLCQFDWGGGT
jgi:hypothetical protein